MGFNASTRIIYRNVIEKGKWYARSLRGMFLYHTIDNDLEFTSKNRIRNVNITLTVLAYLGLLT